MACPEISDMRQQVSARVHGTVSSWQWALQSRYGDPRVYAMQQAEMNQREATLSHDLSRRNGELLQDAYETKKTKNRQAHKTRLAKRRDCQTPSTPPESALGSAPRMPPPPAPRAAVQTPARARPTRGGPAD